MKQCGFSGRSIEPAQVAENVKKILQEEGFVIEGETHAANTWDIRASAKDSRPVYGSARDADAVISGSKGKFTVSFKLGIWGKDMPLPLLEDLATAGYEAYRQERSKRKGEIEIWKRIVHSIDPSLIVCDRCGMVLKNEKDAKGHQEFEMHHLRNNLALHMRMGIEELEEYGPEGFEDIFYV